MLTELFNNFIIFNIVICTYSNLVQPIKIHTYIKSLYIDITYLVLRSCHACLRIGQQI